MLGWCKTFLFASKAKHFLWNNSWNFNSCVCLFVCWLYLWHYWLRSNSYSRV